MHAMVEDMVGVGDEVAEALGLLLRRKTRARLYASLTEGVAEGVDEATYPVLSGLARFGPLSAAQLAEEIGLDRSVVSRHASRLVNAGLLERSPDPSDRRASLLLLSGTGNNAVQQMRRRLANAFDSYLATWPRDEARSFAVNLRRFAEQGPFWTDSEEAGQ